MNPAGALLIWLPVPADSEEAVAVAGSAQRLTTDLMKHFGLDQSDLCLIDDSQSECVTACPREACDEWEHGDLSEWLMQQIRKRQL